MSDCYCFSTVKPKMYKTNRTVTGILEPFRSVYPTKQKEEVRVKK